MITLGTVFSFTVRPVQSLVTERAGGYNILTSVWVAPYFSLGSPCAPKRDLGDCAHARDVVLVWARMASILQGEIMLFVGKNQKEDQFMMFNATGPFRRLSQRISIKVCRVVFPFVCGWVVISL